MPTVGSMGLDMMFRTCTVQVNLDFESERDMIEKFRIGLALQPIAQVRDWARARACMYVTGCMTVCACELRRGPTASSLLRARGKPNTPFKPPFSLTTTPLSPSRHCYAAFYVMWRRRCSQTRPSRRASPRACCRRVATCGRTWTTAALAACPLCSRTTSALTSERVFKTMFGRCSDCV